MKYTVSAFVALTMFLIGVFALNEKLNPSNNKSDLSIPLVKIKKEISPDLKYHLLDCLSLKKETYKVLTVDNKDIYVLAKEDQLLKGPLPLLEKDLLKVAGKELDSDQNVVSVKCQN